MARAVGFLVLLAAACGPAERPTVLAAASLHRVVPEILAGLDARLSFAASSTLARQIEHGLVADVFLSADRDWVRYLQERGIGVEARRFASADLVAWVRAGEEAPRTAADLRDSHWGRIAVGDPNVPVGRYARRALSGYDLDARLLPCVDARAVLAALAGGAADVAITYEPEGRGDPRFRIAFRFDTVSARAEYWALLCRDRPEARRLWERLLAAGPILVSHGFHR